MINKIFNEPHIFHQTADSDMEIEEQPVVVSKDNSGLIVLSQKDQDIILNKKSVKELCDFLKKY